MKAKLLRKIRAKVAWKWTDKGWEFIDKHTLHVFTPAKTFNFRGIADIDIPIEDRVLYTLLRYIDKLEYFKDKNTRLSKSVKDRKISLWRNTP